jgi:hypothetical protein
MEEERKTIRQWESEYVLKLGDRNCRIRIVDPDGFTGDELEQGKKFTKGEFEQGVMFSTCMFIPINNKGDLK